MQILRDADHHYTIDGHPVPGVTAVIRAAGMIDTQWYTDEGRERGAYVHVMCELWDRGELLVENVKHSMFGYLHAWQEFVENMRLKPTQIEHYVGDLTYGFAGTLDITGEMAGRKVVVDRKTGPPIAADAVQTAAYEHCLEGHHRRLGVHLRADGGHEIVEHDGIDDFDAFVGALTCWNWRKTHELI